MHKKAREQRALARTSETKEPKADRLHPAIGKTVGSFILAATHPQGFQEGVKQQVLNQVMTKAHQWVSEVKGRAVKMVNTGEDVTLIFLIDDVECSAPF